MTMGRVPSLVILTVATLALAMLSVHVAFTIAWIEYWLSMVSGEGVNRAPLTRPSYGPRRKMADAAVQFDAADYESSAETEPPVVNSTIAEINSSAQLAEQTYQRPLSVGSSASSSSEGVGEKRRPVSEQELDVDAICVQEAATELETDQHQLHDGERGRDRTEPDGFIVQEKEEEESTCGLDCVYYTMRCCECAIL